PSIFGDERPERVHVACVECVSYLRRHGFHWFGDRQIETATVGRIAGDKAHAVVYKAAAIGAVDLHDRLRYDGRIALSERAISADLEFANKRPEWAICVRRALCGMQLGWGEGVMAYDNNLAARVRERLAGIKGVTELKMFGGWGATVNGNM